MTHDSRFNQWLSRNKGIKNYPQVINVILLLTFIGDDKSVRQQHSKLATFLHVPTPLGEKKVNVNVNRGAHVLTSSECRIMLEEKERKKREAIADKERRKKEREERKKKKLLEAVNKKCR